MTKYIKDENEQYWDASHFQRYEVTSSSPWKVRGVSISNGVSQNTDLATYSTEQEAKDALDGLVSALADRPGVVIP